MPGLCLRNFGPLLMNLWTVGVNTSLAHFREKYFTDYHQTTHLAFIYYSPEPIRFWCTMAYFCWRYDIFKNNTTLQICF